MPHPRDPMTVSFSPRLNRHDEHAARTDVLDLLGMGAVVVLWISIMVLVMV